MPAIGRRSLIRSLLPRLAGFLDFMAELNLRFFAGEIDAPARRKLLDSAGYKVAQKIDGTFLAGYVESVLRPPTLDNNRLSIP